VQYLAWNDRLAAYFFKPDAAGKRVHLSVVSSVIEDIGPSANDSRDDFVTAIKAGPPWVTRQGICQKALQSMVDWRRRDLQYPPYVGYLAFFVLAAGLEGDFAPHAYYPRLRTLLDEGPAAGQYPSFDRMLELWDDLERWANEDKLGELGQFQTDIAGGWINVGIPVAQVILSEQERQRLNTIFAEAGLDPTSSPSDEQFAALLLARGQHRLRPRTLQLLQTPTQGNADIRDLLVSTALEELREWDGQFIAEDGHEAQIYSTLRLCGRVDRIGRRVQFAIRCKSSHDIPDEGIVLSLAGVSERLKCLDYVMGWSSELMLEGSGATLDPTRIDWLAGCSGRAEDLGWRFRLPASEVRVFEDGSANSIPGIVEVPRLQKDRPFYLTCNSNAVDAIEGWGKSGCKDFVDLGIQSGLPIGWRLYYSSGAVSDGLVRKRFPSLAFNSTVRVYFENGVRSTSNQYFTFGLPQLVVDGDILDAGVFCEATRLQAQQDGRYFIPDAAISPGRLSIEVKSEDSVLTRRSLFVSDHVPTSGGYDFAGDRFGRIRGHQNGVPFVAGAAAACTAPPYNGFFLSVPKSRKRRIFIGRVPGQIVSLGAGERPDGWDPVWAILMQRRNGSAIFCGSDLKNSAPMPRHLGERRSLQDWKQVLWHRRKRIDPPEHPVLKELWLSYQEEARKL
jgi:hypothetical protein